MVASYGDLIQAQRTYRRIVLAQHGAGQSYGGDPRSEYYPSYPGGRDNGAVGLFLCPNQYSADRWRKAYPSARVEVTGSPVLETIPHRVLMPVEREPVIAVSFHWNGTFVPEANSAADHYFAALKDLARAYPVIGHGHPLHGGLRHRFQRIGIPWVEDFEQVCRDADVYVCDNSSTIYEFASTGRPVVLLNAPQYRLEVNHGGRFWDWSSIGYNVRQPEYLVEAVTLALEDGPLIRGRRQETLSRVYTPGNAQTAADAIMDWVREARAA